MTISQSRYSTLPKMVIDGLSLPSALKSATLSILAKGLLGLGSQGVPSTRDQLPTVEFQPMILQWDYCMRWCWCGTGGGVGVGFLVC